MLCPNCGRWNDEAEKRCAHCGRLVSEKLSGSWTRSGLAGNEPSPRRIVPTPPPGPPPPGPAWKSEIDRKLEAYWERHEEERPVESEPSGSEGNSSSGLPPIVPYLPPLGRKPPSRENDPLQREASPVPTSLPPLKRDSSNGDSPPAGPLLVATGTTPRELPPKTTSRPPAEPAASIATSAAAAPPKRHAGDITCAQEVAPLPVRAVALVLDLAMIEIAQAIVAGLYIWQTGASLTDSDGIRVMATVFLAILAFYFYFFLRFGGITPGMTWTGLRVVNFDGGLPDAPQLRFRALGTILSFAAAGVGFLWAAVDYEGLTWHDRMSKTFLTSE